MDIYEEISLFAKRQRDEVSKEKKKRRRQVCIDPDSVIGKEIMYQTALLHEILYEIRGGKTSPKKLVVLKCKSRRIKSLFETIEFYVGPLMRMICLVIGK